jgi:hypothetical protein
MRMPGGGEKSGVGTHRLPDEHDWTLKGSGVDYRRDIVGESGAGEVFRHTGAATVAALVDGQGAATRGEVPHRGEPFSRMTSESVQQDDRLSATA